MSRRRPSNRSCGWLLGGRLKIMQKLLNSRFVSQYGMLFVLFLLCLYYSFATMADYHPADEQAAADVAHYLVTERPAVQVMVIGRPNDKAYTGAMDEQLRRGGVEVVGVVNGEPNEIRARLVELGGASTQLDVVATLHAAAPDPGVLSPSSLAKLAEQYPSLANVQVIKPSSYRWPVFLKTDNLRTVLNNISVVAIIAIGMTMVIITAGIDLSVGSLIAFSGVVVARLISSLASSGEPGVIGVIACCIAAIALCALFGLFAGVMVTGFGIPSFVVTLATMQIARGLAFTVAGGPQPVPIKSDLLIQFGAGGGLFGIPNAVVVMVLLYIAAHLLMSHTALGRYIYAVGGNEEAARLSGVPVKRVLLFTYAVCGALAGLGGLIDASAFKTGVPKAGEGYELLIIAAVVVGGTSLAGGEGKMLGTLIGALILAVISNGMYLTEVGAYTQMIVFGALILAAVLLDMLKKKGWLGGGLRQPGVGDSS